MKQLVPDEETIVALLLSEGSAAERGMSYVVDAYAKRLYAIIKRWTNNHEQTNDILQEVFVLIWRKKEQFQGNSSLFSWIYKIAYHETLNQIRKEKKHVAFDVTDPLVKVADNADFGQHFTSEQISEWLQEAILSLPEKQRLVFEMKYFDELKYEEIAAITGGSTGGLKANYFHAVQKIETFLKSKLNH